MSFFGNQQGPTQLTVAKMDAEVMTDYFNRMIKVCNKKCVVKFNEPDLQVGEMSCVDRCVGKYMQAQEKVGEVLQNFEKQMQAQEKISQQAAAVQFGRGPK